MGFTVDKYEMPGNGSLIFLWSRRSPDSVASTRSSNSESDVEVQVRRESLNEWEEINREIWVSGVILRTSRDEQSIVIV